MKGVLFLTIGRAISILKNKCNSYIFKKIDLHSLYHNNGLLFPFWHTHTKILPKILIPETVKKKKKEVTSILRKQGEMGKGKSPEVTLELKF